MEKYTFSRNKLYYIKFLDHAMGCWNPITCEVVGWCYKKGNNYVVVTPWKVSGVDEATEKNNSEPIVLLTATIMECKELQV